MPKLIALVAPMRFLIMTWQSSPKARQICGVGSYGIFAQWSESTFAAIISA